VNLAMMGHIERDLTEPPALQGGGCACDADSANHPVIGADAFRPTGVRGRRREGLQERRPRADGRGLRAVPASLAGAAEIEVGPMSGRSNVVFCQSRAAGTDDRRSRVRRGEGVEPHPDARTGPECGRARTWKRVPEALHRRKWKVALIRAA
jgi:hypothetical protein